MAAEVLQSLGLEVINLLYSRSKVSVYRGKYQSYPVVFKVLLHDTNADYEEMEKECKTMIGIHHEHLVRLYNYSWQQRSEGWYLVMVLEECEKDLTKDINERKKNYYPYSEEELWRIMLDCIYTLAFMQKNGLAHRDIKPENIFLSQKAVKIGDFGSSRYVHEEFSTATLIGTPLYLSPALREGFINRKAQVAHNVFKSDVYSLGLTFVALAQLSPPLFVAQGSESQIFQMVQGPRYSEVIKSLINWMLLWDESQRPDFVTLEEYINRTYFPNPQPAVPVEVPTPPPSAPLQNENSNPTKSDNPLQDVSQPKGNQRASLISSTLQPGRKAVSPHARKHTPSPPRVATEEESSHLVPIPPQPEKRPKVVARSSRAYNEEVKSYRKSPPRQSSSEPKSQASNPYKRPKAEVTSSSCEVPFPTADQLPRCQLCGKDIERSLETAVRLKCDPQNHMFCSLDCFHKRVAQSRRNAKCSICNNPIEQDDIDFYSCPPLPRQDSRAWSFVSWVVLTILAMLLYVISGCKRKKVD